MGLGESGDVGLETTLCDKFMLLFSISLCFISAYVQEVKEATSHFSVTVFPGFLSMAVK